MFRLITVYILACLLLPFSGFSRNETTLPHAIDRPVTPLYFVENKGQITDQNHHTRRDIDYKLEAEGISIFIGNGTLSYQWRKEAPGENKSAADSKTEIYRLDVALQGANTEAAIVTEDAADYKELYYKGNSFFSAHAYNKVTYKNIYPNIDWVLYSKNNQLKYDFIVHPGGNLKHINIRYNGASNLSIENGAVKIETPFGIITEEKPYSYAAADERKIPSAYQLNGNNLHFQVAPYDGTVVIDPVLSWATYFGSDAQWDYSTGLGTDPLGNVYIGGTTFSTNNIATTGAYKTVLLPDDGDAYIAKFSPQGVLQWATYYGGNGLDGPSDIAVSFSGDVYLAGYTASNTGIATAGSHQPQYGGGPIMAGDIYLAKFNTNGIRLWATYYGGYMGEYNPHLCIDADNDVYLSGNSVSTDKIADNNAYQPSLNGGQDGFIAKFNSDGKKLWSTYCGGEWDDEIEAITTDRLGNVYVAGFTTSGTDIATPGAHQTTFANLNTSIKDGFILKFDKRGNKLWGTYYGGNSYDYVKALGCDDKGDLYIAGRTSSTSGIATPGAFKPTYADSVDGFIAKFNANGVRQWGTYFGDVSDDEINSLSISRTGHVFVSGFTHNTTLATAGSMQPFNKGDADVFLAELSKDGNRLYSTYFGGNGFDQVSKVHHDRRGSIYLAGSTASRSGLATIAAHKSGFNGIYYDGFLTRIQFDSTVYFNQLFTKNIFCTGDTFKIAYSITKDYEPDNVFFIQLSDSTGDFSNPVSLGTTTATAAGDIQCRIPAGVLTGTRYRIRIISTDRVDTSWDNGFNLYIGEKPVITVSNNGPICAGDTLKLKAVGSRPYLIYNWVGPGGYSTTSNSAPTIPDINITGSGKYTVEVSLYGCLVRATTNVTVKSRPDTPEVTSNSPLCLGATLTLNATSTPGARFQWEGPDSFASSLTNPTIKEAGMDAYGVYSVIATLNGCTSVPAMYTVIVKPGPEKPKPATNSPVCEDDSLLLISSKTEPGIFYSWTGPGGFASQDATTLVLKPGKALEGSYRLTATMNGCSQSDTTFVIIKPKPNPVIVSNSPVWENDDLLFSVGGTQPGTHYYWTGPSDFTSHSETPELHGVTEAQSGTYFVTAELNGCKGTDMTVVVVHKMVDDLFVLFPIPNNGNFTIMSRVKDKQNIQWEVVSAAGQLIHRDVILSARTAITQEIKLEDRVANGQYFFRIQINGTLKSIPFTVTK